MPRAALNRLLSFLLLAGAIYTHAAEPAKAKATTNPPPGIAIPETDRTELMQECERLRGRLEDLPKTLAGAPEYLRLLPDVMVLHKAVWYALIHDEFFRTNEVAGAKALLKLGFQRASELANRQAPWLSATGLVIRGYRSTIDGSVQPYGLVIPPTYSSNPKTPRRLDVWLHGRDDQLTELKFLVDRQRSRGEFTPTDTIVLHPYGRFCNAFKFAGEVDVFEGMAAVEQDYAIAHDQRLIRGFSMGGAGTWHLAAHYPTLWAVAEPGAGFAETAEYAGLASRIDDLPSYQRKLFSWYDATVYAPNLLNLPLLTYHGDQDKQRQSSDVMEKALKASGLELQRVIGKGVGHKYTPEAKIELEAFCDSGLSKRGETRFPKRVLLATAGLKYPQNHWLRVESLQEQWVPGRIDATLTGRGSLRLTTTNVQAFSLLLTEMPPEQSKVPDWSIEADGETIALRVAAISSAIRFEKMRGHWTPKADNARNLRKRQDLQGPIDDAFMHRFVMVLPTGKAWNDAAQTEMLRRFQQATNEWRRQFRGEAIVKQDTEITQEDIAHSNLILWGDPGSNQFLRRVLLNAKFPLKWTQTQIKLGMNTAPSASAFPVMIYPNPLNPYLYVVLNSGFTFADEAPNSNALQTPKLPDYAIFENKGTAWRTGSAGFFDEWWQLSNLH